MQAFITVAPFSFKNYRLTSSLSQQLMRYDLRACLNALPSDPFPTLPHTLTKYKITRVIQRFSPSVLYDAVHLDASYCCKALSLRSLRSWSALDNLNYEAALLRRLSHPGVPSFVDFFDVDTVTDRIFVLLTSPLPIKSLQMFYNSRQPLSNRAVHSLFKLLLETLDYLSSQRPPVAHGDINPSNVFVSLEQHEDVCNCSLINFAPPSTINVTHQQHVLAGSSQVEASPCENDLYAVALTMLQMITARPIEDFFFDQAGAIDFSTVLPTTLQSEMPSVYRVLMRLLHPVMSHRLRSSADALALLSMPLAPAQLIRSLISPRKPSQNLSKLRDDVAATLLLHMHPRGITFSTVTGTVFAAVWTLSSISIAVAPAVSIIPRVVGAAFALTGCQLALSTWTARDYDLKLFLTVCPIKNRVAFYRHDTLAASSKLIQQAEISFSFDVRANIDRLPSQDDDHTREILVLSDGIQSHSFTLALSHAEMVWFRDEMNSFLESHTTTVTTNTIRFK